MKYLLLLFPLTLFAETTGNILSQDFSSNNWSGTNQSSLHGTGTVAGVDSKYIESTISLSDNLSLNQINGGWTSTLNADMWNWNNNEQITTMSQIITDADGTVTTQTRDISILSNNNWTTYTDSYTQGMNSQSDYDIKIRFDFNESSESTFHQAVDLKNPKLTIEHSLLDTTQVTELKTMSETVYNTVEDIKFYEYIPEEEFTFQIIEQPLIEVSTIEEFFFEQNTEEINTGIIEIYEVVDYDIKENFQEVATEVQSVEEMYASREETEIITEVELAEPRETIEVAREENTPIEESTISENDTSIPESKEESQGADTTEREIQAESIEQDSTSSENTSNVEERDEVNQSEDSDSPVEEELVNEESTIEVVNDDSQTVTETVEVVDVQKIEEKINKSTSRIDVRLISFSNAVANAMKSNNDMVKYGNTNNNLFDTNEMLDRTLPYGYQKDYTDSRNIYLSKGYDDPINKYDIRLQDTIDNRIRSERELERLINGY